MFDKVWTAESVKNKLLAGRSKGYDVPNPANYAWLTSVDNALFQTKPENSNQDSHFTSPKYLERLQHEETKISMDGRGRALDNVFIERLWRTIKYEEVYPHEYTSPKEAYRQLHSFLQFSTSSPGAGLSDARASAWGLQAPCTCDRLNLNKSLHLKLTLFQL